MHGLSLATSVRSFSAMHRVLEHTQYTLASDARTHFERELEVASLAMLPQQAVIGT